MSKKALSLCVAFLLCSLGLYLFSLKGKNSGAIYQKLGRESFRKADEIKVYFLSPAQGFTLKKEGTRWVILSNFKKPAKGVLVEGFLDSLAGLEGELRARGKKHFGLFYLTDDKALHVELFKKGKLMGHILIGKRGPRWDSAFVRFSGDKSIYLVPENLLAKFDIEGDFPDHPREGAFLDLEIWPLPAKEIKKISFSGEKTTWEIVCNVNQCVFKEKGRAKELKPEEAEVFFRKLFPILAEKVLPEESFKGAQAKLSYLLHDGEQGELDLTCKKEKCLLKEQGFVYEVPKKELELLFRPERSFASF